MADKNWDKTNGMEHAYDVRGKRVVVSHLADGSEILLTAEHIPGTIPPQYALKVTAETIIDGDVYIDGITICSDDGGTHQYFMLSDNAGRAKINVDQLNGATISLGTGVIAAGTQRVTLATDDPAVTALQAIQALLIAMGIDLTAIKNSLDVMDDWDESDRAKVNPVVGQAGIAAGSAAIAANTPSVTLATNDPAVTSLAVMDDWDESDRAKVNPIVGQAGISAGSAAIGVTTPSVTLATNDPAVTSVQIMDDWDESDRAKVNIITGQAGVAAGGGASDALTQRTIAATNSPDVTALEIIDDWDESDRAKVNLIAGQAGVAAGSGASDALTQRTIAATNSPDVTALEIMDDWDESDRAKVNIIVGQAGIAAGAGVVGNTVPRVTLASDDPAVAILDVLRDLTGGKTPPGLTLYTLTPANSLGHGTTSRTAATQITVAGMAFDPEAVLCAEIWRYDSTGVLQEKINPSTHTITYAAGIYTVAGMASSVGDLFVIFQFGPERTVSNPTDSVRNEEIDPISLQAAEESLLDTTNVAAATNYYPSSTGMAIFGFKDFSLSGKFIDADGTMTLDLEVTNDEDTASADWISAGLSSIDQKTGVQTIAAALTVTNGTLTFGLKWADLNFKYLRVKMINDGATNTAIIKCRRIY